jgi:hypothetical protein
MSARPDVIVMLALLAGCRAAPVPAPVADVEPAVGTADTALVHATLPGHEQPDASSEWNVFRTADPGVGIVFFHFEGIVPPSVRTLRIHERPDDASPLLARFTLDMPDGGSYAYGVLAGEARLRANVLEYAYEESGIPFDSLNADGSWARVVYAHDAAGESRRGWARTDAEGVGHIVWRGWLGERAQFFAYDAAIEFRDEPGGRVFDFPLRPSDGGWPGSYDYHLEVDSVAGDWIRARVVTPSDACGVEPGPVRDTVAWLRAVDPPGRPRVWFYTRGC